MRHAGRVCLALAAGLLTACATDPKPGLHSDRLQRDYPADIVVHAAARGCRLDDAYIAARPVYSDPPYAYLYARGERIAAALWCSRAAGAKQANMLLILPYTEEAREELNCPGEIETGDPVGGLVFGGASFLKTLEGFTAMRPPARRAPSDAGLPDAHLVSTRQGEVVIYACHEGEWWRLRFK